MKILYHMPFLNSINAGRTIYNGYKNAFIDLNHNFMPLTHEDNPKLIFKKYKPDIFITSLNSLALKYLDLDVIARQKKLGMKVFVLIPAWRSPFSKFRLNESPSISSNKEYVSLIKSHTFGDIYYNPIEEGDPRMDGFEIITGYKHHTVLLAADKMLHFPEIDKKFVSDISFLGTFLPEKRKFIEENVFPLKNMYDLRLYGQEWGIVNRYLSFFQKIGQYFNISLLKSFLNPSLQLEDERKIYTSSIISLNIHEDYQKKFGGDFNERTFKIPACGGFQITDSVASITKYFKDGKEIVIAQNKDDWFDKIDYYIKNPRKRNSIIDNGRKHVMKHHTYHNRVSQLLKLYEKTNK